MSRSTPQTDAAIPTTPATPPSHSALAFALMLGALLAFALNLRGPLTTVPPIIGPIRDATGMSMATAGLVSSIPVLCFGLLTPVVSWLIARIGIEAGVHLTLATIAIGTVVRAVGGTEVLLLGTVVLGAGMTIGNILALMIVARDFPQRTGVVTAAYTAALNVGTMLTLGATAPLAEVFSWRIALGAWGLLPVLSALLWLVAAPARGRNLRAQEHRLSAGNPAKPRAMPRGLLIGLTIAFTCHLLVYYGLTAWLPVYLQDRVGLNAVTAGYGSSVMQILSLVGSFGVPLLAARVSLGRQLLGITLLWGLAVAGFVLAPALWLAAVVTAGVATGGAFTVIFLIIMRRTGSLDENRSASSIVQGIAYAASSLSPVAVGAVHGWSGDWAVGFGIILVPACLMIVVAALIDRMETD